MSTSTRRFGELPLEMKFLVGFGLALGILLAAAVVQYRTIQALVETDRWVAHTDTVLAELERTLSSVVAAESDGRGYLATGDESFVNEERVWGSQAREHIRTLRVLTADSPSQQRNLEKLGPLVEQKQAFMHRFVALRNEQGLAPATQLLATGEGKMLMSEIRALIAAMEAEENGLLEARQAASDASARRATRVAALGSLLALVLVAVAGVIVHKDVIARTKAEVALRRASSYNRSLIEASLDPLVTIAPDGKITDVNSATEKVTGSTRDELIGTDFSDYFTDSDKARAGYQQVFREGHVHDYELEIQHDKGHITPVVYSASVYRDEAGEVIGVFAAARDITERKRAQEAGEAERRRFNDILDMLPAYLALLTPDYHVPFANRFFRERFGESGGRRCYEYLFGRTEPCEICETYTVLKTAAPHHWEWTGPDGRNYDIHDFPFTDADGSPLIMEMGIDITERKRAEEEIHRLNESLERRVRARTAELEATNKELEAFTYSVSHDLRAPLRYIDGFSKMLLEEDLAGLTEDSKRYLGRIREGARQMGQLVDDLLNLARVGRQEVTLQVTGLSSLAREAAEEIQRENPARQIEWKIESLPFVECDPSLMKQVFVNLLSNAAKYTRPRPHALIEVGTLSENGQPVVFVRDNGVGFSMKYADKLFGVFQRLHRAEDFEGTGIGLATVQRILHKHGGHAWAEAELDKGATFYFTLGGGDAQKGTEVINKSVAELKVA